MDNNTKISGSYINLDTSDDRRRSFVNGLSKLELSDIIQRFPALRGDDRPCGITKPELGCFLSHKTIIDQARDDEFALILEDDAILHPDFKRIIHGVCRQNHDGSHWDILFLSQAIHYADVARIAEFLRIKSKLNPRKEKNPDDFIFLNSDEWYVWGAQAYIIHPNSLSKIQGLLNKAESEGFRQPIDTLYQETIRQKKISSKILFPYIVGVDANMQSTLTDRPGIFEHNLHHSLINLFMAGFDLSARKEEALATLQSPDVDTEALLASFLIYKKLTNRPE